MALTDEVPFLPLPPGVILLICPGASLLPRDSGFRREPHGRLAAGLAAGPGIGGSQEVQADGTTAFCVRSRTECIESR